MYMKCFIYCNYVLIYIIIKTVNENCMWRNWTSGPMETLGEKSLSILSPLLSPLFTTPDCNDNIIQMIECQEGSRHRLSHLWLNATREVNIDWVSGLWLNARKEVDTTRLTTWRCLLYTMNDAVINTFSPCNRPHCGMSEQRLLVSY